MLQLIIYLQNQYVQKTKTTFSNFSLLIIKLSHSNQSSKSHYINNNIS